MFTISLTIPNLNFSTPQEAAEAFRDAINSASVPLPCAYIDQKIGAGRTVYLHPFDQANDTVDALVQAEEFVAGFEEDGTQEGIAGILAGLRSAIRRERARPNLLDLLKEAVTVWPQFDAPTELPRPGVSPEDTNAVNGGDLVEWFEPWRRRAAALIASTEGR